MDFGAQNSDQSILRREQYAQERNVTPATAVCKSNDTSYGEYALYKA